MAMSSAPLNIGARAVIGWSHLPSDNVSKDIAPGWGGPGSGEDYRLWKRDVTDWRDLCSYDGEKRQVKAVIFRLPHAVKKISQGFPARPA